MTPTGKEASALVSTLLGEDERARFMRQLRPVFTGAYVEVDDINIDGSPKDWLLLLKIYHRDGPATWTFTLSTREGSGLLHHDLTVFGPQEAQVEKLFVNRAWNYLFKDVDFYINHRENWCGRHSRMGNPSYHFKLRCSSNLKPYAPRITKA